MYSGPCSYAFRTKMDCSDPITSHHFQCFLQKNLQGNFGEGDRKMALFSDGFNAYSVYSWHCHVLHE